MSQRVQVHHMKVCINTLKVVFYRKIAVIISQFLSLWNRLLQVSISEEEDMFKWRSSADGRFFLKSTYDLFFLGRELPPCAQELWSCWMLLEIKKNCLACSPKLAVDGR